MTVALTVEQGCRAFWICILRRKSKIYLEILNLFKKGKEQVQRAARSSTIYDIFHGLDYKYFLNPGGFLSERYNISFAINTDGVNKYSSSKAGPLWPVYVIINEPPKEHRFKKRYVLPVTETNMIQTC